MHDLSHLPVVTPDLLLGSDPLPPPSGPIRFALGDAPEHERAALLQESFARMGLAYEIQPLGDAPLIADVALHALPDLLLGVGKIHGSRNRRTRAMVEDGTDDVALLVNLKGPHLITQGNRELVLGDGEAVFMSGSDPSSYTHRPPGDLLALRFPKARFAQLVNGVQDRYMERIPNTTPNLRFLTNYLGMAWDERTTASPELRHLMVAHIYGLMTLLVGATRDAEQEARGRGLRAARLHTIKQDIAQYLDRSELSLTALAERHRCTPRFLQRLFEMEGTTFTEYVLAQRLARAHRMVIDPRCDGQKISAIAYDCGFGDVSYFNRAFRRRFGLTPTDLRNAK